jgi:Na+-transporting methylmalonyl-CoA/oxaloacetate decarboxylase gamma subunit
LIDAAAHVYHLGMLTVVVFLSFLVALALSMGILAGLLKVISFRSRGTVSHKTQKAVTLRKLGRIRRAQERG